MAVERLSLPDAVAHSGVLAIVRGAYEPAQLCEIGDALVDGGVVAVEMTANSPNALNGIAALTSVEGLAVGAGTVMSAEQARAVVDAGAQFLVMPHLDPGLLAWAARERLPSFPGAFTPTEVVTAWTAGATAVKLFPATLGEGPGLGPSYLAALRGPLADVAFVPTGGVTGENAEAFVAAGAVAVAAASWLVPARAQDVDPDTIRARAAALVNAVAAGRTQTATTTGATA